MKAAYAAVATLRDRLAQAGAGPSPAAGLDPLIDEADRALRATQAVELTASESSAVEGAIAAVSRTRQAVAAEAGTHARDADLESAMLRALAGLDAALGPLRAAAGGTTTTAGPADPTGGFAG